MADIPSDDHSWRKYGEKPIKGSSPGKGGCRQKRRQELGLLGIEVVMTEMQWLEEIPEITKCVNTS